MKTAEVKTTNVADKATNTITSNKSAGVNASEKVNNLPLSTAFNDDSKKEEPKKTELPMLEKAKPQSEQPKAEVKMEAKEAEPLKVALNLESTLKLVEELHRRKIQRDRLLDTIKTLEAFEVAQIDDADETEANHFQGCVLTIEDDERRKFTTKNPVIIEAVAQFVNSMCINRLAEIEAGITIPV